MKRYIDKAIVLRRTNYAEKDRVITLLCETRGKVTVYARGVRSSKSKLAGSIELLSISEVEFIDGKGKLKTLVSARLIEFFENIVKDMDRTNYSFDVLKLVGTITDDESGQEYFQVLNTYFKAINTPEIDADVCYVWLNLRVLQLAGLLADVVVKTEDNSSNLNAYNYNFDEQIFVPHPEGAYSPTDIKLMRLLASSARPVRLTSKPENLSTLVALVKNIVIINFGRG